MKKFKIRKILFLFVSLCTIFVGTKPVNAAIRYDFNTTIGPLGGNYTKINYPIGDDGLTPTLFKYIRVRLEVGSGYGDKIDVYAVASNSGTMHTIGTLKGLEYSGARTYIIDFKAENAPARSDANITVNCSKVTKNGITYSNSNYCIANENYTYGIKFENKSILGGNAVLIGGFSFEN